MGGEGDEVVGLKKEGAERELVLLMHDVFEIGWFQLLLCLFTWLEIS